MKSSIIADLKDSYGLTCNEITPVTGGWLNRNGMFPLINVNCSLNNSAINGIAEIN